MGFAVAAGKLVDLTGVEHLEQWLQRLQVGLAEYRAALTFQAQLQGFVNAQLGAVNPCEQAGGCGLTSKEAEQKKSHQAHHRLVSWCLRCS